MRPAKYWELDPQIWDKQYIEQTARQQWGACLRKKRFNREKSADEFLEFLERKHGKMQTKYRCRYCQGWHLTKKLEGEV